MKKLFAWMKDTGGFAAYIALAIIIGCAGFMYCSVLFKWDNFYSKDVHAASGWWHIAGWALTAGAVFTATKMQERGSIIFFGALIVLSWCAFAGFTF